MPLFNALLGVALITAAILIPLGITIHQAFKRFVDWVEEMDQDIEREIRYAEYVSERKHMKY